MVTDPPRAGIDEPVVRHLLELAPPRIVYVSCNPATQASTGHPQRPLPIDFVQPIRHVPHTYHVENVGALSGATVEILNRKGAETRRKGHWGRVSRRPIALA